MLSRNIVSRRSALLRRVVVRAQSTQVVEESSSDGPIAADGRHEVHHEESYDDNETK